MQQMGPIARRRALLPTCVSWKVLAQVLLLWLAVVGTNARRLPGDLWVDRDASTGSTTGSCFGNNCDTSLPDVDMEPERDNAVQMHTSPAKRTPLMRDVCRLLAENRGVDPFRSSLACGCSTKYQHMDLGKARYPRYINAVQCESGAGWRCDTRMYKVAVLASRDDDLLDDGPKVPEALRREWRFELVDVPVACDCAV